MEQTIHLYTTSWGRCYIREYLDELENENLELFGIVLAKLNRMKIKQCHVYPLVKTLSGKPYKEIRPGGTNTARLFYTIQNGSMVMLMSGLTKKQQKLKNTDLNLADKIYKDMQQGNGTYEQYDF